MSPPIFLILLMGVMMALVTVDTVERIHCRHRLRAAARRWSMHYAAGDRLRLARRIVGQFPVPGAANIAVRNLLFRTEGDRHQYLFTVDYTVGVIRGKVGRSCVAGFTEAVARGGKTKGPPSRLIVAESSDVGTGAYEQVLNKL